MFKRIKKAYGKWDKSREAAAEKRLQKEEARAARDLRRAKVEEAKLKLQRIKTKAAQERAKEFQNRISGLDSVGNMFDLGGGKKGKKKKGNDFFSI